MKDIATLEMTITPYIEEMLKGFPYFLEIEMLQGYREEMPDGRVKYKIEIEDDQKAEIIKDFCLKMISHSHLSNGN